MKKFKKCLVVGHTDAHGVAASAISVKNLERECESVDYMVRFPDTGVIPKFWKETIDKVIEKADEYDKVVLVDIPIDRTNPDLSFAKLEELCSKTETWYIDHHPVKPEERDRFLKTPCNVKIVDSAYECVYGKPDDKWMLVGAISDRDRAVKDKATKELMELADGLDVLVRRDITKAIDDILTDNQKDVLEYSKQVPDPKDIELIDNVALVKDIVPDTWVFKVLDKACRKTGADYAVYVAENRADRVTGEPRDFVTVIKYWKSEKPSVMSKIPEEFRKNCWGHPDAITCSVEVGRGKELAEKIVKWLKKDG